MSLTCDVSRACMTAFALGGRICFPSFFPIQTFIGYFVSPRSESKTLWPTTPQVLRYNSGQRYVGRVVVVVVVAVVFAIHPQTLIF